MDFEKYQNKMEFTKRIPSPTLHNKATPEQARQYGEDLAKWIEGEKGYREKQKEYRAEDSRLFEQFKEDALDDVGLKGHPKADKAWEIARSNGSGFEGIYNELNKLAEVLLD